MNSRYGLNSSSSEKQCNFLSPNLAIKDTSNSLLERNAYMMNSKVFDKLKNNYSQIRTVLETNKQRNNYLDPIVTFIIRETAPINNLNKETLNLMRLKYYSRDVAPLQSSIKQGVVKSYCDYKKDKKESNQMTLRSSIPSSIIDNIMVPNLVCFDKNAKGEIVRRPKGFWDYSPK